MTSRETVANMVATELGSQDRKWGVDRDNKGCLWGLVLTEEVGEVARAALEQNKQDLVAELIQVAAVASAWAESLLAGRSVERCRGRSG